MKGEAFNEIVPSAARTQPQFRLLFPMKRFFKSTKSQNAGIVRFIRNIGVNRKCQRELHIKMLSPQRELHIKMLSPQRVLHIKMLSPTGLFDLPETKEKIV